MLARCVGHSLGHRVGQSRPAFVVTLTHSLDKFCVCECYMN